MKALALLTVLCGPAYAQDQCHPVVHHAPFLKADFSLYFAQEYTGSDLVREEIVRNKITIPTSLVGLIDADTENHGYSTMNLISSQTLTAPMPLLSPTLLSKFEHAYYTEGKDLPKGQNRIGSMIWDHYADKCGKEKSCPSFMNKSMYISNPDWFKVLAKLTKQNTIVIAASGNWFEDPAAKVARLAALQNGETIPAVHVVPPLSQQAARKYDYLLVGSTSTTGTPSDFSNGGENVFITAPSANVAILTGGFLSRNATVVKYEKFGGTSGAAPLVTAAMVIFEAVSGHHPTMAETKTLLKKSAIKLEHSTDPENRHGVGNLNTLKIFEVAKRIKLECDGRPACASTMIDQDSTYLFAVNPQELQMGQRAFPTCFKSSAPEVSCEDKTQALKILRKLSLLNPEDKTVLSGLSCVYESLGYKKNAKYYQNVSKYN
ncbi:MAG TPA: S8/S53 family peptidase [Bacteriovoracaceae bacterium]|nr:S8/S53 family peptidase [Bacteriovoracaceae bacterium]